MSRFMSVGRMAAAVAVAGLALSACGGDSGSDEASASPSGIPAVTADEALARLDDLARIHPGDLGKAAHLGDDELEHARCRAVEGAQPQQQCVVGRCNSRGTGASPVQILI